MIIDQSITIQKPLFDVFKTATDYEQYPTWQTGVSLVKLTSGDPIRTGTMLYMEKQFLGGKTFVNADIVEFQRNKSIEMQGIHGRFRFKRIIDFSSSGRDTVIRERFEMNTGCLYFWYNPILQSALTNQIKQEQALLKKKLEG
jgi:uncharacterized membrane protein